MNVENPVSFTFVADDFASDTFFVADFEGEEAIGRPFHFDLTLAATGDDIDLDRLVDGAATFSLIQNASVRRFKGDVLSATQKGGENGLYYYDVVFGSPLHRLARSFGSEAYIRQDVPAILERLLKGGGLLKGTDYETRFTVAYTPLKFQLQYQESGLDYLNRLLEREGIYYYEEFADETGKLVFTDSRHSVMEPKAPLTYRPSADAAVAQREATLQHIGLQRTALPATVAIRNHDYRQAGKVIEATASVSAKGSGERLLYGENVRNSAHAQSIATIRAEELGCRERVFRGVGSAVHEAAGGLIDLQKHPRDAMNRRYLVTSVTHQGSRAGELHESGRIVNGEGNSFYQNEPTMIPGDLQFRPERITQRPAIAGTLHAFIDGVDGDDYAMIDQYGRYTVRLPFAKTQDHKEGKASHKMRMATPYAGGAQGMSFPLLKGTEVALAFFEGDPDRPYIAYALPNSMNQSVVNAENRSQAKIQTASGNVIHMEDEAGKERILLNSEKGGSWIRIGAPNDPPSLFGDSVASANRSEGEHAAPAGGGGGHGELDLLGIKFHTVGDKHEEIAGNERTLILGAEEKGILGGELKAVLGGGESTFVIGLVETVFSAVLLNLQSHAAAYSILHHIGPHTSQYHNFHKEKDFAGKYQEITGRDIRIVARAALGVAPPPPAPPSAADVAAALAEDAFRVGAEQALATATQAFNRAAGVATTGLEAAASGAVLASLAGQREAIEAIVRSITGTREAVSAEVRDANGILRTCNAQVTELEEKKTSFTGEINTLIDHERRVIGEAKEVISRCERSYTTLQTKVEALCDESFGNLTRKVDGLMDEKITMFKGEIETEMRKIATSMATYQARKEEMEALILHAGNVIESLDGALVIQ